MPPATMVPGMAAAAFPEQRNHPTRDHNRPRHIALILHIAQILYTAGRSQQARGGQGLKHGVWLTGIRPYESVNDRSVNCSTTVLRERDILIYYPIHMKTR